MAAHPLDTVRLRAQQLAQDAGPAGGTASGVQLLLTYPHDYDEAVTQALRQLTIDAPTQRVVDHTLTSDGWRLPLTGASALATLVGANAFVLGSSALQEVWAPYLATLAAAPLDWASWRTRLDPGDALILELVTALRTGDIVRLVFTAPHTLTDTVNTVPAATMTAVAVLAASVVLQIAANKAAQNTGTTGLPNDIVDRRTQSDILRSRSKDLREQYNLLMGRSAKGIGGDTVRASSGFRDLDVPPGPYGFLWRDTRRS